MLIIDPQNDFSAPNGALYVPGAEDDCKRIATFIKKNIDKIDSMHVTLDTHPTYHIAHPCFWRTKDGKMPELYTTITYKDVQNETYIPADLSLRQKVEDYLLALENRGRYNLCIWPMHCLAATWGYCVEENISNAIREWELYHTGVNVNYINKAYNQLTEHYSAIQAEVPDPNDSTTRTNFAFIDKIKQYDRVIIAGEALSHCVASTLRDLSVYIPTYKMVVLTDCTSNVKGFDDIGEEFVNEFKAKGVLFCTSNEINL